MATKKIAYCAVAVALLIAVQYALSFISGVELVTVILATFCYTFGAVCGAAVATTFSLLRCFIFGFYPNVIILYLIYYNLFALLFAWAGKKKPSPVVCPIILGGLAAVTLYFAIAGVPVSVLQQKKVTAMLWAMFALEAALAVFYVVLWIFKRGSDGKEVAFVTTLAAVCTVCFTLLDDALTPLFYGYSFEAATAYFYASFIAMLPQTICAAVSVFLLFAPLKKLFYTAGKNRRL